jgi:GT2 family glycosyltransferase
MYGVTVVVPTLNRGGYLYDCLTDLLAQDYRPLEILVVDQSEKIVPEVERLVAAHPELISYHRVSFIGLPEARNYGWQNAEFEVVVFVDDDIRCEPTLVNEHLRALNLPLVGLVAGGIIEQNCSNHKTDRIGKFNYWTATPLRGFAAKGEGEVEHAPGGNFSVWRNRLKAVGGFDEAMNVGAALYEETELCLRIKRSGYRIYFNGKARLIHLAASGGGCRVDEVSHYVRAMAHNRCMLIRRYLKWYHKPTAIFRLMLLAAAFSLRYRQLRAFLGAIHGAVDGWQKAVRPPQCTQFLEK